MGQDIVGQNFVGQDVVGALSLGQEVSGAGGSGAGSRESFFGFFGLNFDKKFQSFKNHVNIEKARQMSYRSYYNQVLYLILKPNQSFT